MRVGKRTVHCAVTIGAAGDIGLRVVRGSHFGDGMTVDAGARLICAKQVVGGGTVWDVAVATVLGDGRMFVDVGARLGLMTLRTLSGLGAEANFPGLVRAVAVRASQHPFAHGMVGGEVQAGGDLGVTTHAKLRIRSCAGQDVTRSFRGDPHVKWLAIVRVMTIGTKQTGALVFGQVPGQ